MTWPQITMLVWLLFSSFVGIDREVSNRQQSAGMTTFGVLFTIAVHTGIAAVLHAGGFW